MPENPFWDYSLAHYAKPGVAQCCLNYQDQNGANVNLLLLCCWLGSLGRTITSEQLEQAGLLIAPWDQQAVQPLRGVRRFIKAKNISLNSPRLELNEFYNQLQQMELMAERVVQNELFDWAVGQGFFEPKNLISEQTMAVIQRDNLNTYLSLMGCDAIADNSLLCGGND